MFITKSLYYFAYCTLLIVACTSCSLSSGNPAKTNEINTQLQEFDLIEIQNSPYVYEIKQKTNPLNSKYFLTKIEDCNSSSYKSLGITARRLLVGLKGLKILELNTISFESSTITRSRSLANFDGSPIDLVTYTVENSNCVKDIAVWTFITTESNQELYESRGEIFNSIEQGLMGKIIRG